ncbi:MAG: hypothetical protein E7326_08065 [Clostridiales bacterium]|nr:hypothetical protein [Clostridiales bacterium]
MKKLRKMLGDVRSMECEQMMRLIETQSAMTLSRFAVFYVRENVLPLLESRTEAPTPCHAALDAVQQHWEGQLAVAQLRPVLKSAREYAAALIDPVSLAAARAIATAAAVILTPTNALGFLFYLCAARAYALHGTDRDDVFYDRFARDEFLRAQEALLAVSVPDEPNKARIQWTC